MHTGPSSLESSHSDGSSLKFFGCDNNGVPCHGISYNSTTKIINFNGVLMSEITGNLATGVPADALVTAGDSFVLNGTLLVTP
ncbi:hypothetical protein BH11PSE7_BH11PSE7_13820 [soil metagenome]